MSQTVLSQIDSQLTTWQTKAPTIEDINTLAAMGQQLQAFSDGESDTSLQHNRLARYYQITRPVVNQLLERADSALAEYRTVRGEVEIRASQVEAAAATLDNFSASLNQLSTLMPQSLQTEQGKYARLQSDTQELQGQIQAWRRFQHEHSKIETLLEEARKFEETRDLNQATSLSREARDQAQALKETLAGKYRFLDESLISLANRAQAWYNDYRQRHEVPLTFEELGTSHGILSDLNRRARETPTQTVTFFTQRKGDDTGSMPVEKALEIARDRFQDMVKEKVEEYCVKAEMYLQRHAPREARSSIYEWRKLPGLFDETILTPGNRQQVTTNITAPLEKRIEEAYTAWKQADDLVTKARQVVEREPVKAYEHYLAAQDAYPHHADLPELEKLIGQHSVTGLQKLLQSLESDIRQADWNKAGGDLKVARELSKLVTVTPEIAEQLARFSYLYNEIAPMLGDGAQQLDPERERQRLAQLRQTYQDSYWNGWQRFQQRLEELEARQNVKSLLQEVTRLCNKQTAMGELENLQRSLQYLIQHPHQAQNPKEKADLERANTDVNAWLGYARAREQLAQADKQKGVIDDATPLELVVVPDLGVIAAGITDAQKSTSAKRAADEDRLESRLQMLRMYDHSALVIVNQVEAVLKQDTVLSLQQLIDQRDQLETALKQPSSHRKQLLHLYRTIEERLRGQVKARLEELVQVDENYYRNLNITEVEKWLKEYRRVKAG